MFEIYTFFENRTEIRTFFENGTEICILFENRFEIYSYILFENRTEIPNILSMADEVTVSTILRESIDGKKYTISCLLGTIFQIHALLIGKQSACKLLYRFQTWRSASVKGPQQFLQPTNSPYA